jgi:DNA repair protein RecO
LWRLEKVELMDGFLQLRKSLEATAKAMYALELCREVCPEGEPMRGIFSSFIRLMKNLQQAPGAVAPLMRFELTMLRCAGWAPKLHACERCNAGVLGQSVMVSSSEGVVCASCSKRADNPLVLSKEALVLLWMLQRQASANLSAQKHEGRWFQKQELFSEKASPSSNSAPPKQFPDERQILEMRSFLDRLWLFHLGKELKARAFMDEMAS